jgi:5-methylcytosine-specific restriction endonuclease McrA
MQKLARPADDPEEVFVQCISRVRDKTLKTRLMSVKAAIISAAQSYERASTAAQLFRLQSHEAVNGIVTKDEMEAVYTDRMAKKNAPGRPIYDRLLAAPAYGKCPLCGQRIVSTLDHHLPKSLFPALAVLPINLVPACADCNKAKLEKRPNNAEEQTLHPYFDDIEDDHWLFAKIIETSPPVVRFFVKPPDYWDTVKAQRVHYHFKVFGLAHLYTSHAAAELSGIQYRLSLLFEDTGYNGVANHLRDEAESRVAANRNSWQAALYKALADSGWYCSGGFKC